MAVDLKGMTEKQLQRLATDITKELAKRDTKQRDAAIKAATKVAKQHGFDLGDLLGGQSPKKRGPKKRPPAPPKYRNPADAAQTWSGRGRRPEWFKAAQKAGKSLKSLEI